MNKFVSLLIVLLAIAVATPVLAEDRLSLSGQMRVRGYVVDNADWNDDVNDSTHTFNQRLRLGGKLSVAEGVAVNFRIDLWEGNWGEDQTIKSLDSANNLAFMTINKGMFTLKAGKQTYSLGNAIAIDTLGTGFVLGMGGQVPVEFSYFKMEENATGDDDDKDVYTIAVKHKTDMYNATVFGGFLRDASFAVAQEVMLVGVQSSFKLDPINLGFELNYFDGDQDTTDYKGLQAYVDVNTAITETVTLGGNLFYAQGQDGGDMQVTNFTNDGSFIPESYGFMSILFAPLRSFDNAIFDPSGQGKGSMGAQVYTKIKLMDALSVAGNVGYVETDEDATNYESWLYGTVSARYVVAKNTNLDMVYSYAAPEAVTTAADDAKTTAAFRLAVNF